MNEQLKVSNEEGLQTDQLKTLLPAIQVIRNYNTKFLMDLTPRIHSWSPTQTVGDIFLQVVRIFLVSCLFFVFYLFFCSICYQYVREIDY